MNAAGAALPEFKGVRNDPVAAPEGGQGDFSLGEFVFQLHQLHFQQFSSGNDGALLGDPRAELGFLGTGEEVFQGFRAGNLDGFSVNDDLAFQHHPGQHHADLRVFRNVMGLVAAVVREKDKARLVKVLEQHRAQGRPSLRVHRSQGEGVRFRNARLQGLLKPGLKLFKGVLRQVFSVQLALEVFFSEIGQVHDGLKDECYSTLKSSPRSREGAEWVT